MLSIFKRIRLASYYQLGMLADAGNLLCGGPPSVYVGHAHVVDSIIPPFQFQEDCGCIGI